MVRDFDGRRVVTRTRDPGAVEQATTVTTAEPAFDFHGGMTGLLLAALPLRIGFQSKDVRVESPATFDLFRCGPDSNTVMMKFKDFDGHRYRQSSRTKTPGR